MRKSEFFTFLCDKTKYCFYESGDIFQFLSGPFMINRIQGNPLDGSINNIYLRIYSEEKSVYYPLLGINSKSSLEAVEDRLYYRGNAGGIKYVVTFAFASGGIWFWNINLKGNGETVDLVYGQDTGVAEKEMLITNDLYASQYIDHFIATGLNGYLVCSRQNLPQNGKFPFVQQGCLNRNIKGYSTDETQFFGRNYRKTNIPIALQGNLENKKYQFELSYIALQTEKFSLEYEETITFYGIFKEDHPEPVSGEEFKNEIEKAYESIDWSEAEEEKSKGINIKKGFGQPLCSQEFTIEELNRYFPERVLEETQNKRVLSFFCKDYSHVALQEKEILMERNHGNILTTLINESNIQRDLMTSTNYMYGLFFAQVAVGNTDMNKLLSANRGLLNISKTSGMRIYLKFQESFRILTLPAAYEMGINYSRWFYKLPNDVLTITSFSVAHDSNMVLIFSSEKNQEYDLIITNQLVMGYSEFSEPVEIEYAEREIILKPVPEGKISQHYPALCYKISLPDSVTGISDDRVFYEDGKTRNETMLTIQLKASSFSIYISGYLEGCKNEIQNREYLFEKEKNNYLDFYQKFGNNFNLSNMIEKNIDSNEDLLKLNILVNWYTHNALVHFAAPHGLEQYNGAAWGTRDVCQGPIEFFLATGHFELVKHILTEVFSHQSYESKEWPQWFMFDKYQTQMNECHGDVVFWPLKCLGDYLDYTEDLSILNMNIPYRDSKNIETEIKTSLLEHVKEAVVTVEKRFVYDTALISYAGGDWDDSLQPADQNMKEKLVSSWTQALAYQTIEKLAGQLKDQDFTFASKLASMAQRIKEDFETHLIKDKVISGFVFMESADRYSFLLHPDDDKTGINYRLIPLTRSIISNLVDKSQADYNIKLISEHLAFPDGVRLMNKPARYERGISKYFKRAEQAANVGREIGLQYVHAHIRYIESLAKYGDGEKAYKSLLQIVPPRINDVVKNAGLRQSNSYFSSSEGDFLDRYEYQNHFNLLKTGDLEVKGGWRVYSSGPGLFISCLITNLLGIRCKSDKLEIDPVLPRELDGLVFEYECFGIKTRFVYHVESEKTKLTKIMCNEREVSFSRMPQKYRTGGGYVTKNEMISVLKQNKPVHIYLCE